VFVVHQFVGDAGVFDGVVAVEVAVVVVEEEVVAVSVVLDPVGGGAEAEFYAEGVA
jgi:hypothetical protein